MNIVIKLTSVKITESWPFYSDTCKLSEDRGKYSGDPATVALFRELLHLDKGMRVSRRPRCAVGPLRPEVCP